MGKITRTIFTASYAVGDPRYATQKAVDTPRVGVFLSFSLVVRADISWPGRADMASYAKEKINKLRSVGIFDDSDLKSLDARLWDSTFVHCIVEIDDLQYAQQLFDKATDGNDRIVDVYLYRDGKIIDKLD
ncbi:MAG: hypothetical protein Q8L24_00790 [bacterium]|nr:hypothetical protein [bacterium]